LTLSPFLLCCSLISLSVGCGDRSSLFFGGASQSVSSGVGCRGRARRLRSVSGRGCAGVMPSGVVPGVRSSLHLLTSSYLFPISRLYLLVILLLCLAFLTLPPFPPIVPLLISSPRVRRRFVLLRAAGSRAGDLLGGRCGGAMVRVPRQDCGSELPALSLCSCLPNHPPLIPAAGLPIPVLGPRDHPRFERTDSPACGQRRLACSFPTPVTLPTAQQPGLKIRAPYHYHLFPSIPTLTSPINTLTRPLSSLLSSGPWIPLSIAPRIQQYPPARDCVVHSHRFMSATSRSRAGRSSLFAPTSRQPRHRSTFTVQSPRSSDPSSTPPRSQGSAIGSCPWSLLTHDPRRRRRRADESSCVCYDMARYRRSRADRTLFSDIATRTPRALVRSIPMLA